MTAPHNAGGINTDVAGVKLVSIWVDPSIDEQIEVCYCVLYFFIQRLLADDAVSSLEAGYLHRYTCSDP